MRTRLLALLAARPDAVRLVVFVLGFPSQAQRNGYRE